MQKKKKNFAISKPSENLHIAFQRKTKGKIKIYYHLLKILLKINKTNTNKTQQKSPTLSPSLYISLCISFSPACWPTLRGGSWDNSFAYKLWEAGIVIGSTLDARSAKGKDFHVQISASPTLCIIISSVPKKETIRSPNPAIIPMDTSRFRPNPPAVPLPQKAPATE